MWWLPVRLEIALMRHRARVLSRHTSWPIYAKVGGAPVGKYEGGEAV